MDSGATDPSEPLEPLPFSEVESRGRAMLKTFSDLNPDLGFDEASVEWLDNFIARNRYVFSEEGRYGVALGVGYIFGETIIRAVGGQWQYDETQQKWVVDVGPPLGIANPIIKAYKHLNDDFESISSMLRIAKAVVEKGGWDNIGTRLGDGEEPAGDE